MISREDMTSLTWLKMHWETYYEIHVDEDGLWQAQPVGADAGVLTADTALRLRDAMKDDLAAKAARKRQLCIPGSASP